MIPPLHGWETRSRIIVDGDSPLIFWTLHDPGNPDPDDFLACCTTEGGRKMLPWADYSLRLLIAPWFDFLP
jgi:hypothetical protein